MILIVISPTSSHSAWEDWLLFLTDVRPSLKHLTDFQSRFTFPHADSSTEMQYIIMCKLLPLSTLPNPQNMVSLTNLTAVNLRLII